MKRSTITILSLAAVVLGFIMWGVSTHNRFVALNEGIEGQWGEVQSAYQRRADLIPNLVATVKGYADFEQETLTQVIEARANATAVNLDASNLTPENIAQFQQAQGALKGSLSRLLVTVERYPRIEGQPKFLGTSGPIGRHGKPHQCGARPIQQSDAGLQCRYQAGARFLDCGNGWI